ncbi:MAG: hypothetical protein WCC12_13785, partial [Anaerolineales bacterium]
MKKTIPLTLLLALTVVACQSAKTGSSTTSTPSITSTPADGWQALFQRTPVPWTTHLPAEEPTVLDATYVK